MNRINTSNNNSIFIVYLVIDVWLVYMLQRPAIPQQKAFIFSMLRMRSSPSSMQSVVMKKSMSERPTAFPLMRILKLFQHILSSFVFLA